ncbi:unnamed protein product [Heligmosomoides polygyrus]|uniref:Solute carrier family 40 protein n=1 Tax=Heligmosomoides polygyrus TaxID=6339 RepID=A0A183G7H9_HELPZ|nr:unnamed protein product [Heligmosomoides polygyrus]
MADDIDHEIQLMQLEHQAGICVFVFRRLLLCPRRTSAKKAQALASPPTISTVALLSSYYSSLRRLHCIPLPRRIHRRLPSPRTCRLTLLYAISSQRPSSVIPLRQSSFRGHYFINVVDCDQSPPDASIVSSMVEYNNSNLEKTLTAVILPMIALRLGVAGSVASAMH